VDARRSRRELEAARRERVDRARSRYEEKAAIRKEMVAKRSVWPINREPDPDGRYVLSVALQEESAARTAFMCGLTIHSELRTYLINPVWHRSPSNQQAVRANFPRSGFLAGSAPLCPSGRHSALADRCAHKAKWVRSNFTLAAVAAALRLAQPAYVNPFGPLRAAANGGSSCSWGRGIRGPLAVRRK
jgi:hypothetical protein